MVFATKTNDSVFFPYQFFRQFCDKVVIVCFLVAIMIFYWEYKMGNLAETCGKQGRIQDKRVQVSKWVERGGRLAKFA